MSNELEVVFYGTASEDGDIILVPGRDYAANRAKALGIPSATLQPESRAVVGCGPYHRASLEVVAPVGVATFEVMPRGTSHDPSSDANFQNLLGSAMDAVGLSHFDTYVQNIKLTLASYGGVGDVSVALTLKEF